MRGLQYALELKWEARRYESDDDPAHIADASTSEILYLDIPLEDASSTGHYMLQQLLHAWENQANIHALTEPPLTLAVLAGRFQMIGGDIHKYHGNIVPNEYLEVPVYSTAGFLTKRYMLNSYIIHVGITPYSGHYAAVLKDGPAYMRADDNDVARIMTEAEFQRSCSQSYLFFYQSV